MAGIVGVARRPRVSVGERCSYGLSHDHTAGFLDGSHACRVDGRAMALVDDGIVFCRGPAVR